MDLFHVCNAICWGKLESFIGHNATIASLVTLKATNGASSSVDSIADYWSGGYEIESRTGRQTLFRRCRMAIAYAERLAHWNWVPLYRYNISQTKPARKQNKNEHPSRCRPCSSRSYVEKLDARLPFFHKSVDFWGFAKICQYAQLVKNAWNSCGFVFLLRNRYTIELCMWYKIFKGLKLSNPIQSLFSNIFLFRTQE